jgi:hemoglobin-like flavoprotein
MPLNVEVLESSFEQIKPHSRDFAASFYNNLFVDYPHVRSLFEKTSMEDQYEKLMVSLAYVLENLRHPHLWRDALKNLGGRHMEYGVIQTHYPMVGAALLQALQSHLGPRWTPEVKQAWTDAYGAIVDLMLEGADYPVAPAPPAEPKSLTRRDRLQPVPARPRSANVAATAPIHLKQLGLVFSLAGIIVLIIFLLVE